MDRHSGLGFLSRSERQRLETLLMRLPDIRRLETREALVDDQVPTIRDVLRLGSGLRNDIHTIISMVDAPGARLYDGTWPITWVIENAVRWSRDLELGRELLGLLYASQARAKLETAIKPEARLNKAIDFADIAEWPRQIDTAIRAVCMIETGDKDGTGFLVGPDLVMTNWHVVDTVLANPNKRAGVKLRFDHLSDSRGTPLFEQKTHGLAADREILFSPFGELDCALLPVQGRPGDEAVARGEAGPLSRGWLKLEERTFSVGQPIFIVQHPDRAPLKVAVDLVLDVLTTRVRYRTNTDVSSSGAPCFNDRWEPVALHQGTEKGDSPKFNQGVPFGEILRNPKFKKVLPA